MARTLVAALTLLSFSARSVVAAEIPDDVATAAEAANVNPVDLFGAVLTTHIEPFEYLYRVGELQRPPPPKPVGRSVYVRLTYYTYNSGVTANGGQVYMGSTACSLNFAFGTKFVLPDGSVVTCNDRGRLYYDENRYGGWLDVYARSDIGRLGAGSVTVLN